MKSKYTIEILEPIIKQSKTWVDVCRLLGVKPMTGTQSYITKIAKTLNINHDHFLGCGHNKGKFLKKRDALEYCYNGSKISSHNLKLKLIRDGYKKKSCEICGSVKWFEYDIPLELHHIDGNHLNNELNNLKILCSNCHSIETQKQIENKKNINKINGINKAIKYKKKKNKRCKCGKLITNNATKCSECYHKNMRKVQRPTMIQLKTDVNSLGYVGAGKKYGVSDNTIRKWCINYNILNKN